MIDQSWRLLINKLFIWIYWINIKEILLKIFLLNYYKRLIINLNFVNIFLRTLWNVNFRLINLKSNKNFFNFSFTIFLFRPLDKNAAIIKASMLLATGKSSYNSSTFNSSISNINPVSNSFFLNVKMSISLLQNPKRPTQA